MILIKLKKLRMSTLKKLHNLINSSRYTLGLKKNHRQGSTCCTYLDFINTEKLRLLKISL